MGRITLIIGITRKSITDFEKFNIVTPLLTRPFNCIYYTPFFGIVNSEPNDFADNLADNFAVNPYIDIQCMDLDNSDKAQK